MMRGRPIVTLFFILLYISLSSQDAPNVVAERLTTFGEMDRVARAVNEFGYKLMLKMMKENVDKNIVISPTGVAGLLAMSLLGSVGSTYDELAKVLGFSSSQDILLNRKLHEEFGELLQKLVSNNSPETLVNMSTTEGYANESLEGTTDNSTTANEAENQTLTVYSDVIVVDNNTRIRNSYREYVYRVYHGDTISAQFSDGATSRQLINDWVKSHTGGKIEEFLEEPLPADTKMVLLTALYFSGQWSHPFLPQHTRNMTFSSPSGEVVTELMLNTGGFEYVFDPRHELQMIAFPYKDGTTTMYVIKPVPRSKKSLADIMDLLDHSLIDQLIQNMTNQQSIVRFPKMNLSTKVDLQKALKQLGIKTAFAPGQANFALMVDPNGKTNHENDIGTRIQETCNDTKKIHELLNSLPNPGVFIDAVIHDVKMTINEFGTVAVAATSAFMSRTAVSFYADSPFYMFIRNEETKLVTFSAVIFDPTDT